MFQIVILDVDGTILDSQHKLHPHVSATIRETLSAGVRVVLATGKLYTSIQPLIAEFGLSGPQITCNGAAIVDAASGATLRSWPLHGEPLHRTLRVLAADSVPVAWYTSDRILTDAAPGLLDETLTAYLEPTMDRVPRLDPDVLPPPLKLLTTGSVAELAARLAATAPLLAPAVRIVRTAVEFLEYMDPVASKGSALTEVLAMLGIARAASLAIGDGENDIPLFAAAGLGLAMANAMPALHSVAHGRVPSNDEQGVVHALRQYVLDRGDARDQERPAP